MVSVVEDWQYRLAKKMPSGRMWGLQAGHVPFSARCIAHRPHVRVVRFPLASKTQVPCELGPGKCFSQ